MLELLLYCHMFANMRFAGHIAAVMDFIGEAEDALPPSVRAGRAGQPGTRIRIRCLDRAGTDAIARPA